MRSKGYLIVLAILIIWNLFIFMTPFIGSSEIRTGLYSFFSYFCHQIPERSLTPYDVTFGAVEIFYKFPVCTRDLSFYFFLLIGVAAYTLFGSTDSKKVPDVIWLILAAVPMAIDGTTQLLGLRESTNLLRFLTGSLLGFVCAYYLIPLVNISIGAKGAKKGHPRDKKNSRMQKANKRK